MPERPLRGPTSPPPAPWLKLAACQLPVRNLSPEHRRHVVAPFPLHAGQSARASTARSAIGSHVRAPSPRHTSHGHPPVAWHCSQGRPLRLLCTLTAALTELIANDVATRSPPPYTAIARATPPATRRAPDRGPAHRGGGRLGRVAGGPRGTRGGGAARVDTVAIVTPESIDTPANTPLARTWGPDPHVDGVCCVFSRQKRDRGSDLAHVGEEIPL